MRELQDLGYGLFLVPLTRGKFAIIDAADAPLVAGYNWCARHQGNKWYAARGERLGGKNETIFMHRALLGAHAVDGLDTDHENGDGLDNRRANLRPATKSQNQANVGRRRHNTSGYKGVVWHARAGKWAAYVRHNDRPNYLGLFVTPEEAHAAYCEAAKRLHGEFARGA